MNELKVNGSIIKCPSQNNENYVAIRSICQCLGIDHKSQFERIKNDEILGQLYTDTVYSWGEDKRQRKMFCLPVKYVFGWLFSIDEIKINAHARPTFIEYKKQCYEALYNHFIGGLSQQNELNKKEIIALENIAKLKEELSQASKELKAIRSTRLNNQLSLEM